MKYELKYKYSCTSCKDKDQTLTFGVKNDDQLKDVSKMNCPKCGAKIIIDDVYKSEIVDDKVVDERKV